jgi:hypothetical protein
LAGLERVDDARAALVVIEPARLVVHLHHLCLHECPLVRERKVEERGQLLADEELLEHDKRRGQRTAATREGRPDPPGAPDRR